MLPHAVKRVKTHLKCSFEYRRTIVLLFYRVIKIPDCCCSPGSYLVVCAHVQHDRQALLRRHPSAGRVEGQFAYWDAHSVAAQVSQPQDSLSIRHTDSLQRPPPSLGQSFGHTYQILNRMFLRVEDLNRAAIVLFNQTSLFVSSQPARTSYTLLAFHSKVTLLIRL